jgi:hypothetical protein
MYKKYNKYKVYKTENEFSDAIGQYFKERADQNRKPTINGLANYLGFSVETLKNFPNTDFKSHVEHAITYIADYVEEKLMNSQMHLAFWLESQQRSVWGKKDEEEIKEQRIHIDKDDDQL